MNVRVSVLPVILLALSPVEAAPAEDWPHWRGPRRNAVIAEQSRWNGGRWVDSKPVWEAQTGEGSTSPLIVGGRLYVIGWRDGSDHLSCLEARSGKPLWDVSYKCPRYGRHAVGDENAYAGPTSTPEYDAETKYLYTLGCDGDFNCWNTDTGGEKVWGLNLYDRFHVGRRPASQLEKDDLRDYGYTTAPFVHREWVIVEVGSAEGNLMAFDKRTGERRWISDYRRPAGHTGGLVPITVEGVLCLAVLALQDLAVVRLDEGREGTLVASDPWKSAWANNVLTPAVQDDCILISSFHSHHAICKIKVTLRGAERLWEQPFASHVGSPVVQGDHVYLAGERLMCLDWKTGRLLWEGGAYGYGGACIATADDKLIVWSDRGLATLVENARRSPDAYRQLARHAHLFPESQAWPHPAIADGLFYCKDRQGDLKCFHLGG
jgi:outer membrane protein assembly factor BamB